jgi:peptidoglycan hydrolase CwlO-like protein
LGRYSPADPYLAQIAQLLVDSADVPTDASDVANGAAIVGTVKRALDYLDAARDDNRIKREKIAKLELLLEESRNMNKAAQAEIERLNNQVQNWTTGANELQDKYLAAQQEIGSLTAKLDTAKRTIKRWEDEAANNQARYEGMGAALRIVLELAGVGK